MVLELGCFAASVVSIVAIVVVCVAFASGVVVRLCGEPMSNEKLAPNGLEWKRIKMELELARASYDMIHLAMDKSRWHDTKRAKRLMLMLNKLRVLIYDIQEHNPHQDEGTTRVSMLHD